METLAYKIGKHPVQAAKAVANAVGKTIAYPILGNLSEALQDRLQSATNGWYSARSAAGVSLFTNLAIYPVAGLVLSALNAELSNTRFDPATVNVALGLVYAIAEGKVRSMTNHESIGSLPGKIVSLPLEAAVGAYDGIRARFAKPKAE